MDRRINDSVFDGMLIAALNEYVSTSAEALPSDEEIEKMYPLSKGGERKYKKIAKARSHTLPLPFVYFRRVAAVFLIVISLAFAILLISPGVRAAIADTVVEWYEKYIKFNFGNSSDTNENILNYNELNIGYIPEGFELESSSEDSSTREYIYTADNGGYIVVAIYSSDTTSVSVDIEDVAYEEMTINNNKAFFTQDESDGLGVLVVGNSSYTILITSYLEKSEIIKIAENIK